MAESIPANSENPSAVRSPVQKARSARIDVAGEKMSAVGVSARHDECRFAHHVGRKPCRNQFLNCFAGRRPGPCRPDVALLRGRKLISKCTQAAPASIMAFINSNAFSVPQSRLLRRLPAVRTTSATSYLPSAWWSLIGTLSALLMRRHMLGHYLPDKSSGRGTFGPALFASAVNLPSADVDRFESSLHLLHAWLPVMAPRALM